MVERQLRLQFPKKELRKPKQFKAQARQAEGCPYHNGRFEYNCFICNPR